MAVKVPFQRTIVDENGDVVPLAKLRVQRAISGTPLAPIFDGPTGVQIDNPATADANGFVQVYVDAGFFNFTPLSADGATTIGTAWEDIPLGDAAGYAAEDLQSGINLNIVGEWDSGTTYDTGEDVTYNGLIFRSLGDDNLNNEPEDSPPASDANWAYIAVEAKVTGTSATSIAVGTGSKSFVTQAGLGWVLGTRLKIASAASPSNWMEGPITAYGGTALTINAEIDNGSGTIDSWVISIAGEQGPAGTDPGLLYTYQDPTTEAAPGSGNVRFNNADLSAATELYVDDDNRAGDDLATRLNGVASWGIAGARATLTVTKSVTTDQATFDITAVSNETGYTKFTIAHRGGITALTDEDAISLQLVPYGPAGNDGVFSGAQTVFTDAANDITAAMSGRTLIANRATAIAFNFDDAATLGSTWSAIIKNENAGTLTLEPDGSETIDGEANKTLAEGESLVVHCDGTNLRTALSGYSADAVTAGAVIAAGNFPVGDTGGKDLVDSGVAPSDITGRGVLAVLEDQKSQGTHGGASTTGSWLHRNLNTEVLDPLGIVSISSNTFTPTVDCIADWVTVANRTDQYQSRLYNVTDTAVTKYGTSGFFDAGTPVGAISSGSGAQLVAGKTYRVEVRVANAQATNGLGAAANFGTEVFTSVTLRRAAS